MTGEDYTKEVNYDPNNKVMYCLSEKNAYRKYMRKTVTNPVFDNLILVLIVITSIALAFENPLNDPNGKLEEWLKYLEYFSTAIFVFEVAIKVIATGFVMNGK